MKWKASNTHSTRLVPLMATHQSVRLSGVTLNMARW